jgi:hypothetical protein
MKSITDHKPEGRGYPYLGINPSTGVIVMFTSLGAGVQLNEAETGEIGEVSTQWLESNFRPFHGSIRLSNK